MANISGRGRFFGTVNSDVLRGSEDNDEIYGGRADGDTQDQSDKIYGYGGSDTLYGNGGNDYIYGGLGRDRIYGGVGNDFLFGEQDNDIIFGGPGSDSIRGGLGDDVIYGGSAEADPGDAADIILGEDGIDTIYGNGGNDKIYGGFGADRLYGGGGSDTFVFTAVYNGEYENKQFRPRYDVDSILNSSDIVYDFTKYADRIDVSNIDADTRDLFDERKTVKVNEAFTTVKAGQSDLNYGTIYYYKQGSDTIVQAFGTNLVIVLAGYQGSLDTGDFVL